MYIRNNSEIIYNNSNFIIYSKPISLFILLIIFFSFPLISPFISFFAVAG